MKIAIIPNPDKRNALQNTAKICEVLQACGAQPIMLQNLKACTDGMKTEYAANYDELMQNAEAIVTVGGDGTIIHAAKYAVRYDRPLIGVNCGRLGFLAELETEEIEKIRHLVSGEYVIVPRMMLDVELHTKQQTVRHLALNDISITRGNLPHMIELGVEYQQKCFCNYRADGLIFSTPTGSTAYALSAGGPVIDPATDCILMTPICPHTLLARPVVFGAESTLCIHPVLDENETISASVDGEVSFTLHNEDCVAIKRAAQHLRLIQLKSRPFYDIFTAKFTSKAE